MTPFNLVDEPWIPVRYRDGTVARVGLARAFDDQQAIAAVVGPSPLATFALYRLLLAIAHRAVGGPRSDAAWGRLLAAGQVEPGLVRAYLDTWRPRFDLFDRRHPFYQDASATGKEIGPVSKLCQERAGGNNATLFDHTLDAAAGSLTPAEAAVQLLVVQGYSLGGLVSVPDGADASHKSAKAGPLVKTVGVLVGGSDLGSVLTRNMLPYVPGKEPFESAGSDDMPAWEREGPVGIEPRTPAGYTDLLTWQSRRIRLVEDGGRVTGVFVFKGESLPEGYTLHRRDPALAFRPNRDPKATLAWLPLTFDASRALWRDARAFGQAARGEEDGAPMILKALVAATESTDDLPAHWTVEAYGLASDQAKALFWRAERFDWPPAYLRGDGEGADLVNALEGALGLAEAVGRTLGGGNVRLPAKADGSKPPEEWAPLRRLFAELGAGPKDMGPRADGLGAQARYWAALGPAFQRLVLALPEEPDASRRWAVAVDRAAREAFGTVTTSFRQGGRQLRALAKAEQSFRSQLRRIVGAYAPSEEVPA